GARSGWAERGRSDVSRGEWRRSRAEAWFALRTVGLVQRRARAMADGAWPSALAKRIWQRRAVNASAARRPVRSACRCSGLSGGTKSWGCMTHYSHSDGTDKDLPCPFTRRGLVPTGCPPGGLAQVRNSSRHPGRPCSVVGSSLAASDLAVEVRVRLPWSRRHLRRRTPGIRTCSVRH